MAESRWEKSHPLIPIEWCGLIKVTSGTKSRFTLKVRITGAGGGIDGRQIKLCSNLYGSG
jgi:hypothetical protein